MLFQTPEFLVLMLAVLGLVYLVRTHTLQIVILLVASYIFYMSWNPIFILLIVFSTVNDYICGLGMGRSRTRHTRTLWLLLSCVTNLGLLGTFKYFDFFIDSVNQLMVWAGWGMALPAAQLTLPVGISFYTFQSMSYTIDVYRGDTAVERSFLRFALYVAFFPQLVAGPILRSTEFLPQLQAITVLRSEKIRSGCNLFLVGLVKKVLIADHVGPIANLVFDSPQGLPSPAIWLGTLAFGIQIYCDFSGYTDMARGAGRMLGFHIPLNFNYPYAARSITDFWRRWHISLSSWLRDYLYIPLGGNRNGTGQTYRNLMLTMGLGGLWHGAGWNFVAWGLYQGGLLAFEKVFGIGGRRKKSRSGPQDNVGKSSRTVGWWLWSVGGWVAAQYFVFLGWLLFRVRGLDEIAYCTKKYVLFDFDFRLSGLGLGNVNPFFGLGMIGIFVILHALSYQVGGLANRIDRMGRLGQFIVYVAAVFCLISLWPTGRTAFIYFQF